MSMKELKSVDSIMNTARREDWTWAKLSEVINEIYNLEGVSIDPMKHVFYKKYSYNDYPTKEAVMNQFHQDTKHLRISNVLFWGSERFGYPCYDFKVEFHIIGGVE